MRTFLGPTLLTLALALPGLAVLHAISPFRRGREALAAGGLAFLVGASCVGLALIGLVCAGARLSIGLLAATALLIAAVGAGIGTLRGRRAAGRGPEAAEAPPTLDRLDRRVLMILSVIFGAYALAALSQYTSATMFNWDAWAIWTNRGAALYWFGGLDPRFFANASYAYTHQDYPLLLPMLEALHFQSIGRFDPQSVHVQIWLILVAFPWAMGRLVSRAGRAAVWGPIVFGAVTVPAVYTVAISGLADVPVAIWITCGVLAMGMWIDGGRRADLVIAAILLAGAASLKNEGMLAALAAFLVAAVVLVASRPRRGLPELGVAGAGVVAAILPWQLWAAGHHVPKDLQIGDALNPGYLASHVDRASPAVRELLNQLTNQSRWSYFLPLALLACAVAFLVVRRARRAAAFYALTAGAFFAALVWAYWASPYPIGWYLQTSGFRVVGGVAGIAMAALAHLAPRLAAADPIVSRVGSAAERDLVADLQIAEPSAVRTAPEDAVPSLRS